MIAFGVAISDEAKYERLALPGIRRAAEPDSPILTRTGSSIQRAYNEMMDEVAGEEGLEALVLLHQDLELTDDSLAGRLRRLLRDPCVGLVGALGAGGFSPHVWSTATELRGTFAEPSGSRRFSTGSEAVAGVDGILLALAPWAVRALRFNEAPAGVFHGYDVDMNLRVRAHGGVVLCDDIPYFHHREPAEDHGAQAFVGVALAHMWDPALRPWQWAPAFGGRTAP